MRAATIYGASPIKPKRGRRTNAELRAIYDSASRILTADRPMTVRGVFYRLVSEHLVAKTENEYDNVGRYLVKLRREREIPFA